MRVRTIFALIIVLVASRTVGLTAHFVRGDADGQNGVDLADVIFSLNWQLADGAEPSCLDAADANDDGRIDVDDALMLLRTLFTGGAPLPAPFPDCGSDETEDELNCEAAAGSATCPEAPPITSSPRRLKGKTGATQGSASPGNWQLRLEQLNIGAAQENGLLSDGDEPYIVLIGFSSKFGIRGSTQIYRNQFEREYWDGLDRPDSKPIPPEMGVLNFGEVDTGDLGLVGAVAIAMESDGTSWGRLRSLFNEIARLLKIELIRLVEGNTLQLTGGSAAIQSQINAALGRIQSSLDFSDLDAVGIFISSWFDVDNMVGIDRRVYVMGLQPLNDLLKSLGFPPISVAAAGIKQLGEDTFQGGVNPFVFDGTDVPPQLYGGGLYSVDGRMTSTVLRAGDLTSPASRTPWWGSVDLRVELCPGCHPVSFVHYYAHYDKGDGRGRRDYVVAYGDPSDSFSATWDITGVPPQEDVEVWAEFISNSFGGSVDSEPHRVGLNIDTEAPFGRITSPMEKSVHGDTMRFAAQVGDSKSGVDRVEFSIHTNSGTIPVPGAGTAATDFSLNWNVAGIPEQVVRVGATVFDKQGNRTRLDAVEDVHIDHTPPTVSSVYPSSDLFQPTWITSNGVMLRATAEDYSGVQEVIFTAYDDLDPYNAGYEVDRVHLENIYGEFSTYWDLSNVPDQVDPGFPRRLYIDVTAVDNAGNRSLGTGWIAGFDRTPPEVRIVRPFTAETVSGGDLAIEVEAGDNLGVDQTVKELVISARYYLSSQSGAVTDVLATLSDSHGWSGHFNVDSLPEQTLSITARATDAAGRSTSLSRNVIVDRTAPTVFGVRHSDDPFIANGTRTQSFSYQLSERADRVTILIRDGAGQNEVETTATNVNTDPQVALWDGRDKLGNVVPSGTYTYSFEVVDRAGNVGTFRGGSFSLVNDSQAPQIQLVAKPDPWSPRTGRPVSLRYSQSEEARAEIEILDGNQVIRYVGAWRERAGVYARTWDGLDAWGRKVAPKTYNVRLRVVDLGGNQSTLVVPITVVW